MPSCRDIIVAVGKVVGETGSRAVSTARAGADDGREISTYQSRALMWPSSRQMNPISNSGQRGVLDVLVDGILSKQALGGWRRWEDERIMRNLICQPTRGGWVISVEKDWAEKIHGCLTAGMQEPSVQGRRSVPVTHYSAYSQC